MKVILLQDIKGTGKKDQIMEISDGYARNYLLPRKLAKEATAEALNAIERSKSADKHREDVRRQEAEALAHQLKGKVVQRRRKRKAVRLHYQRSDRGSGKGAAGRRRGQAQDRSGRADQECGSGILHAEADGGYFYPNDRKREGGNQISYRSGGTF